MVVNILEKTDNVIIGWHCSRLYTNCTLTFMRQTGKQSISISASNYQLTILQSGELASASDMCSPGISHNEVNADYIRMIIIIIIIMTTTTTTTIMEIYDAQTYPV